MGKPLRAEPEGSKFLEAYPQVVKALQKANWLQCIKKFKGYHKEVTKAFARSFQDENGQAEVGDVTITVSEGSIAKATSLPQTSERWFKNRAVQDQQWKQILQNPGMNTSIFTKGIPVSHVKEKWKILLLLVQKIFTCEGRFGALYVYHGKIMQQFQGEHDINLPYFLFQSLRKMCSMAQRNPRNIEAYLCHHSLVKLLIEDQLKEKRDTWERFLVRNHFEEPGESSTPKKSRRNRKRNASETIQGQTEIEPIRDSAQEIITETLSDLAKQVAKKRKEAKKKQKQEKGKSIVQEIEQTTGHSSDDSQPLTQRLAELHKKTALSKDKQRQTTPKEKQSTTSVRRSCRLSGKMKTVKGPSFIDLSSPGKDVISPSHTESVEASPPREDSPFQHELEVEVEQEVEFEQEIQVEHEPEIEHEPSPMKSPEVDPEQQKLYNYLETLEQAAAGPSTLEPLEQQSPSTLEPLEQQSLSTVEQQIHSLKQEIFEIEVLNRHIIQENEKLKERGNVDKMVHDNTMLHMGLLQKENKKLRKKCKRLDRDLINLRFRCLMKRPRVDISIRRKRRRLDVLAEASQQVD